MSGGGGAVRMASLNLDTSNLEDGVNRAKAKMRELGDASASLESQMKRVHEVMDSLAELAGVSLTLEGLKEVVVGLGESIMEVEVNAARISAVIKATGDASGITRAQIEQLDELLSHSTLFNADQVERATAVMLSFKNVQGDTFKQALKLSADLAQLKGIDLQSAAQMIGRALNDPATGLVMLTRAGAGLSAAQREMAKSMDEAGNKAGAQKIIIDALTKSIGGTAEAANTGLAGALSTAKNNWHDFIEVLANSPQVAGIAAALDYINSKLFPQPQHGSALLDDYVDKFNKVQELQKKIANESPSTVGQFRVTRDQQQLAYAQQQLRDVTKLIVDQSNAEEKLEVAARKSAAAQNAASNADELRRQALAKLQEMMKAGANIVSASKSSTLSTGMNVQDPELGKAIELSLTATTAAQRKYAESVLASVSADAKQREVMKAQDDALKEQMDQWQKNKDSVDSYVNSLKQQLDALTPAISETERYRDMLALAQQTEGDAAAQQIKDLAAQVEAQKRFKDQVERYTKENNELIQQQQEKWHELFDGVKSGFTNLFRDTLSGALTKFRSFVNQMIGMIEQLAAEMAAQQLVSALFSALMPTPGLPSESTVNGIMAAGAAVKVPVLPNMHMGGIVPDFIPRLHTGLAPDEFPAILQKGESVIPKGVSPGHTFNVNMTVMAMDSHDVIRVLNSHKEVVAGAFFDAVYGQSTFQQALKHLAGAAR